MWLFILNIRGENFLNTRVDMEFQRKTFQCIVHYGVQSTDDAAHSTVLQFLNFRARKLMKDTLQVVVS